MQHNGDDAQQQSSAFRIWSSVILYHLTKTGEAAYRAAIRVWRKGIMAELDSKGYYVKRMADEIVRWG